MSSDPLEAAVAERVASGKFDLPLLPQVAQQVMTLVGAPSADATRLAALIHKDPALAGQVLRVANSAAYAPSMPIVSLQQAVARLGLNTISEISFAASIQSGVFRVPGYEADLKALWGHAVATGVWAKEVARSRRTNVESAFLCGLLHAVGKPALLQIIVDAGTKLGGGPNPTQLAGLIERHHIAVAERIARIWKLPAAVVAVIMHCQTYQKAGAFVPEATTTFLAARLATWTLTPDVLDETGVREDPVVAALNLYPDDLSALLGKKDVVVAVVSTLTV